MPAATVAVIGAGISGLIAAHGVAQRHPHSHVVVYERSGRPGGVIRSAEVGGVRVETGPDGFAGRDLALGALCTRLGLSHQIVAAETMPVELYSRGRRRRLPAGMVMGIPTDLHDLARSGILHRHEVVRAAADLLLPVRSGSEVSVGEFVRRRMGDAVTLRVVEPLLGGIYAGSLGELGTDAVLPGLREESARHHGLIRALRHRAPALGAQGLFTLRGGLQMVVDALAADLSRGGGELVCNREVRRIDRCAGGYQINDSAGGERQVDAVIVATPAGQAARLLGSVAPMGWLHDVPYSAVAVVVIAVAAGAVRHRTCNGLLIPAVEGRLTRAVTYTSAKWQHLRSPDTDLVRCSVGGRGDMRHAHMSDREIIDEVERDLRETAGITGPVVDARVVRWPAALPQYRAGHHELVAALRSHLPGNLGLIGAAYDGVGLTRCAQQGMDAAAGVTITSGQVAAHA